MLSQEKPSLVIRASGRQFASCIEYIFQLFGRVHGYECVLVSPSDPAPDADIVISYSDDLANVDTDSIFKPHLLIQRGTFFGPSFGKSIDPPSDFATLAEVAGGKYLEPLIEREGEVARMSADLPASAFYMLSGYHDWISTKRDSHGRTLSTHVPLPPATWDTPIVNHWFRQLHDLLQCLQNNTPFEHETRPTVPGQQTICLTHDVDLIRKYRLRNLPRQLVRASRAGGTVSGEWKRASDVFKAVRQDPYESFDQLYAVKNRISAPSTFFFMGSDPGPRNGDYDINSREIRNLFTQAKSNRDEIALHGSYESGDNPALLAKEKAALEKACGQPITGNRQHYLRFNTPGTWKTLNSLQMRYDSTGGFADRSGFKYGWSGCFYPFNLDTMKPLETIEIPLVSMDVTLAVYEKIPAELALERLTNLLDASCDNIPGGAFIFLWHNIMGDKATYPGYWDTFEYFFSIASGSARFITLSQLCDEFESR